MHWPFHTLVVDLIGPINPPSRGYIWILAVTKCYIKWVEAIALKKGVSGVVTANFIRDYVIYCLAFSIFFLIMALHFVNTCE